MCDPLVRECPPLSRRARRYSLPSPPLAEPPSPTRLPVPIRVVAQRVWNSLFFNNYGPREVVEQAGMISYNWGAPFYLCFNTIHINGRTCICMASSVLGLDKLRATRDEARKILLELAVPREDRSQLRFATREVCDGLV